MGWAGGDYRYWTYQWSMQALSPFSFLHSLLHHLNALLLQQKDKKENLKWKVPRCHQYYKHNSFTPKWKTVMSFHFCLPEGQRCPSYLVRNCRFSSIANFSPIHLWNCCCALFCPNIHYVGCKHTFVAHSRCLWFASFDKYILKQEGPYLWRPIAPHNVTSSHSRCKKPQPTLYSMCGGVLYLLEGRLRGVYILEGSGLWGHSAFSTSAAPLMTRSHDKTKAASLCFFMPMCHDGEKE